ncbi:hypothetical protein QQF64_003352 [Cirrhinus molitorella]|uniref:AIG1-type G domain-containing protein n=1 Tax=Cirrhinus molitorella TaxID=172907 RepID=A0ABR3ML25_9TELE
MNTLNDNYTLHGHNKDERAEANALGDVIIPEAICKRTESKSSGKMSKHQENNQTELRAVLIGRRYSGKASVINTILETSETEAEEDEHVKREGFIDGRRVSLVKTPGWWKTLILKDLSNISKQQLNNGKHFDIEKVKEVNKQWEENKTRASFRKSRVQKERSTVQEKAYMRRLEEIRVVLFGWVLAGKSSSGNTILNRDEFAVGGKTREGKRGFGDVDGRKMTVLNTPGWWKYFGSEFNPDFIGSTILESVSECKKFPHAMLLVIPADTSFQKEQKRIIEQNMVTLGDDVWRHTIVLFTWGDRFKDISIEQHIEAEGEALQWLIEKCRNRYHIFDNTDKKNRDQVSELLQKIDEMVAENSSFCLITWKNCDEKNSQTDKEKDLNRLKDFCHYLDVGFKKKAEDIRRKIENLSRDIMKDCLNFKESQSMDDPINYKPPDEALNVIGTLQQDNIPEPIKTLLEREFSRWESIIIDGVQESLQDIKSSFELSQAEKWQKSMDAVERWLQNYNHYVQHTIDKIQAPEPRIRRKRLKKY